MKLNEIAIDGLVWSANHGNRVRLDAFNLIRVDQLDSALRLRHGVRHVLFGTDPSLWKATWLLASTRSQNSIELERAGQHFRVARDLQLAAPLRIYAHESDRLLPNQEFQWLQQLDLTTYATFFDLDQDRLEWQMGEMVRQLPLRWHVPIGENYWKSESDFIAWKRDADSRKQRWTQVLAEIAGLEADYQRAIAERDAAEYQLRQRRQQLETELHEIETRLHHVQTRLSLIDSELANLEREHEALRYELSNTTQEVRYVPVQAPHSERLLTLYAWLDATELDLARWRKLQSQIQSRRILLRDEMTEWNERTLADERHPYFHAHELLEQTLAGLDQLDAFIHTVNHPSTRESNVSPLATADQPRMQALSAQLRQAQESLIQELGQQFTQIRHRAAAAEMKELREVFQQAEQAIASLTDLRRQTIDQIHQIDPVGAKAIETAEAKFVDWAQRDGYLSARRKFFGAEPAPSELFEYQLYQPDLTIPRQRLKALEAKRQSLQLERSQLQSELSALVNRRELLLRERDSLTANTAAHWQYRLPELERRLGELRKERDGLSALIADDDQKPSYRPNRLLALATQWLNRLTGSELYTDLNLTGDNRVLTWQRRSSQPLHWNQGDSPLKELTVLSLSLAACEMSISTGSLLPLWLTGFGRTWDDQARQRLASCLQDLVRRGIQVFWVLEEPTQTQGRWMDGLPDATQFSVRSTGAAVPNSASNVADWKPVTEIVATHLEPHTFVPLAKETRANWSLNSGATVPSTPMVYTDRVELRNYVPIRLVPPLTMPETQTTTVHPAGIGSFSYEASAASSEIVSSESAPLVWSGLRIAIDPQTGLRQIDLIDPMHLKALALEQVHSVGDLLELDPLQLPPSLEMAGITANQMDRWQAQAWLLVCTPGMTPTESRVLVACGVTEPEHLENSSSDQLAQRIQRYLQSPDGRRLPVRVDHYDAHRMGQWQQALRTTRPQWRRESGYSRRNRLQNAGLQPRATLGGAPPESYHAPERSPAGQHFGQSRSRELRPGVPYFPRTNNSGSSRPSVDRPTLHRADLETTSAAAAESNLPVARTAGLGSAERSQRNEVPLRSVSANDAGALASATTDAGLKFYLNLHDPVEAAPSIGPKTAERFIQIGVNTIEDFLRTTADSMAEKIDFKRISAEVIRQWQQQARLVCRVPNLRSHDAQLLVSCGITEPEDLAAFSPRTLLDRVGPFADTKEGLKIIRAGKKPDLQEVTDWIQWAKHTRSIQAA